MNGKKRYEVRMHAPVSDHPYKVYLYCTKGKKEIWLAGIRNYRESYKMNGKVCGEFTCVHTLDFYVPESESEAGWIPIGGTCLERWELVKYAGGRKVSFLMIKDPVMYNVPRDLADFGVKHAPQSWCYIGGKKE